MWEVTALRGQDPLHLWRPRGRDARLRSTQDYAGGGAGEGRTTGAGEDAMRPREGGGGDIREGQGPDTSDPKTGCTCTPGRPPGKVACECSGTSRTTGVVACGAGWSGHAVRAAGRAPGPSQHLLCRRGTTCVRTCVQDRRVGAARSPVRARRLGVPRGQGRGASTRLQVTQSCSPAPWQAPGPLDTGAAGPKRPACLPGGPALLTDGLCACSDAPVPVAQGGATGHQQERAVGRWPEKTAQRMTVWGQELQHHTPPAAGVELTLTQPLRHQHPMGSCLENRKGLVPHIVCSWALEQALHTACICVREIKFQYCSVEAGLGKGCLENSGRAGAHAHYSKGGVAEAKGRLSP